ncbi:hypothetical protein L1987_53521 [Smallanthus sonchifolius]|uniref:Uncharacterized protein n=1 Tax=Smallanthus sonchifolius TaxID=185202 RepID=A0ACB9EWJ4_9ASTR|nr:hypothetical protein L1987_53521 [Smallanthus sonchifolius]
MSNRSHKTFFMPMLCRPSLNDVVKPPKFNNSISSSTDPSSPKLTCIGQIKKKSTTTSNQFLVAKSSAHSNRYTKLQRLFSGKNLISPAIDTGSINNAFVAKRSKSCNGRARVPISKKKCYISSDDQDVMRVVVDEELDPPLPVVKCNRRDQKSDVNLWKRRGIEMKTLQIQPIQLNMNSVPKSATTF